MELFKKESEITELSLKLLAFSRLVDRYYEGRVVESDIVEQLQDLEAVDLDEESLFNRLLAYSIFATSYCALKCRNLSYQKAYYNNVYVNKEIGYLHSVFYTLSRIKEKGNVALLQTALNFTIRTYVCLANAYDHMGRFNEAIQYYRMALEMNPNDNDAEMNLGYAFANMHSFWVKEEPYVVARAQGILKNYADRIEENTPGLVDTICSWPVPVELDDDVKYGDDEVESYCKWVNENYLRLNKYVDISPHSILSQIDNVELPSIQASLEENTFYVSTFNEIVEMFQDARMVFYRALNIGDSSAGHTQIKMAYKHIYSIFDKIALFLCRYLNLADNPGKIDFSNLWFDGKSKSLRREILSLESNLSLLALYSVRNDVYGSRMEGFVIDEQTRNLKQIRNYIEHRTFVITEGPMVVDNYCMSISVQELASNTVRLMQLVRCAIIYLCNFILQAEYDKGK